MWFLFMCPLRERIDEVPEFIDLFGREYGREGYPALRFDKDLLKLFEDYDWPEISGNYRIWFTG